MNVCVPPFGRLPTRVRMNELASGPAEYEMLLRVSCGISRNG